MVTKEELLRCSIRHWYSQYESHTFPTILVPLPEEFVSWLLEDGLFLPASNSAFPTRNKQDTITAEDDYKDWSTSEADEENTNETTTAPNFPDLIESINAAISELGGSVIPKLTWSVPKDATWVAVGNTLRCNTADQVLLLLKSSDRIAHDLEDALAQCSTDNNEKTKTEYVSGNNITLNRNSHRDTRKSHEETTHGAITTPDSTLRTDFCPPGGHILALRKWYDLKPGREFRCFVISGQLKGISQRDVSRRYEELESESESIKERIVNFHQKYISSSGNGGGRRHGAEGTGVSSIRNYTYDCYVPSTAGSAVKIIDFNPAGGTTAPLLFGWEELLLKLETEKPIEAAAAEVEVEAMEGKEEEKKEDDETPEVELRIIIEDVVMRPDTALYGVPYDFVDYSQGSALRSLMEKAQRGNASDDVGE